MVEAKLSAASRFSKNKIFGMKVRLKFWWKKVKNSSKKANCEEENVKKIVNLHKNNQTN